MATLDELKAKNLAAEEEPAPSPQEEDEDLEEAEDEDEPGEIDEDADPDEDPDKPELEDWQKSDEDADPTFDNSDMANVRRKYKAKLDKANEDHDQETQKLKTRIEHLEKGGPTRLEEPKLEDFESESNPEHAHLLAHQKWQFSQLKAENQATRASTDIQHKQQEERQKTDVLVDQHYERAAKLSEKSNISAEAYQASDLKVRQSVESLFPKGGDLIIDSIIARLGDGSEKVMYSLGVNKSRLAKFVQSLEADSTGIAAAMYLGELKTQLDAPGKRTTKAKKPASQIKGDRTVSGTEKSLKRKYDKAVKDGDMQARLNARRAAKEAKVDITNW